MKLNRVYSDALIIETGSDVSMNTKRLIYILLYTIFSGALRKWVFPGGGVGNLLLGIQLLIPYMVVFLRPLRLKSNSQLALFLYCSLLALLSLHPLNKTIFHGMIGFVIHSTFWVSLLVLLDSNPTIARRSVNIACVGFLVSQLAVGLIQYQLPNTHPINLFATGDANNGHAGSSVRVAGTFSHFGGYGGFVLFAGFVCWRLIVEARNTILTAIAIICTIGIALISGSRLPILAVIMMIGLGFVSTFEIRKVPKYLFLSTLVVVLVSYVVIDAAFVENVLGNVLQRFTYGIETGESTGRAVEPFVGLLDFLEWKPFFGTGLGGTYQGAVAIWGESLALQEWGGYEEEMERTILEGGFTLFIAKIVMGIFTFSKLRIPLLAKILLFVLIFAFTGTVFFTFNVIFTIIGLYLVHDAYSHRSGVVKN